MPSFVDSAAASDFYSVAAPLIYKTVGGQITCHGDTVMRRRKADKFKRPMYSMTAFSADELMTEEPTVPQHPLGWVPEDDEEPGA